MKIINKIGIRESSKKIKNINKLNLEKPNTRIKSNLIVKHENKTLLFISVL